MPSPAPRRRSRRHQAPQNDLAYERPNAARFSEDPELSDPVFIVRELQRHPQVMAALAPLHPDYRGGRRREEGSWALLYLAFLCSDVIDMKTWAERLHSSDVWSACGFAWKPNYRTVWMRFTELEAKAEVFEEAARVLIRVAMEHDDRIGRHVHVDFTGFTTHARLVHACPDEAACAALWRNGRKGKKPLKVLDKPRQELVIAEHHRRCAEPEPRPGHARPQFASIPDGDVRLRGIAARFLRLPHQFFDIGGHVYATRDLSAGVRHYARRAMSKEKFWEGGRLGLAVDDTYSTPLAVLTDSCGENEWTLFPRLADKVEEVAGDRITAYIVDRGMHIRSVFERNLAKRIGTVAPWREPKDGIEPSDLECAEFDRHGVVRCRYCGSETTMHEPGLGIYLDNQGKSRLKVQCRHPHVDLCHRPQSIACSVEPRLLQPINRDNHLFWDLLASHQNKEALFLHWRQRYGVAGNDFAERPKRRQSIPCQALRASAALLIDWLRVCLRHGFIGGHPTRNDAPLVERETGGGAYRRVLENRDAVELRLPYGPAAVRCGLARDAYAPGNRPDTSDPNELTLLSAPPPDGDPTPF